MRFRIFLICLFSLMSVSPVFSENEPVDNTGKIEVILQDLQGMRLKGYLSMDPAEVTVTSKEREEKSLPLKAIQSIKFEPFRSGLPGPERLSNEGYYSVRLRNSHEIFMLKGRYTLNLNTEFGLLVREIDPTILEVSSKKDSSSAAGPKNGEPFIRDKSMIFSIEFKF